MWLYVIIGVILLVLLLYLTVGEIKVYRKRKFYLKRAGQCFDSVKKLSSSPKDKKNLLDTETPLAEIETLKAKYLLRLFLFLMTVTVIGTLYFPVARLVFLQYHEHIYLFDEILSEPTCSSTGLRRIVCRYCEKTYEEIIPCTEHSYELADVVPANCQHGRLEQTVCSVCGDVLVQEDDFIGEHDYQMVLSVLPTCTTDGKEVWLCEICGDSYEEIYPMLGHDFTCTVEVKPSCTSIGINRYECLRCGTEKYEELPEKHAEGSVVDFVPANCIEDGYTVYECNSCGKYYTEIIPANGEHDYLLSNVNPHINCYDCQYCGVHYETYHIDIVSVPFLVACGLMLAGIIIMFVVHSDELFWDDTFRNPVGLIALIAVILSILYIILHFCLFFMQGLPTNSYDEWLIKHLT